MIHILDVKTSCQSVCGSYVAGQDQMVDVAMESDCEECRSLLLIAPPKQKGCEVKSPLMYEAKPLPGAENMLDEVQRKRDGR